MDENQPTGRMIRAAAIIYAACAVVLVGFQIALAFGAPWGHLAMGGQWPGVLPVGLRVAAIVQAGLVAGFAWAVLARAELVTGSFLPSWFMWIVLVFALLGAIANLATPSEAERALWAPIAIIMLVCSVWVHLRAPDL